MREEACWILADAATSGVVRFGLMQPGAPAVHAVQTLQSDRYHTFTDALLAYVTATGVPLKGSEFAMAVPGPPTGDVIPMARSRWTISRSGLGSIFGRPATIVNDVAAASWALVGRQSRGLEPVCGRAVPRIEGAGRWAVVLMDEGVGTAAVDVTDGGTCLVLDSEAGHGGFAPNGEAEQALTRAQAGRAPLSWEQALVGSAGHAQGRGTEGDLWARIAGSFVGDVVFQLGAWAGVILTGRSTSLLRDPRRQAVFVDRMQAKARFQRQLASLSLGLLPQPDALAGLQALMLTRHAGRLR